MAGVPRREFRRPPIRTSIKDQIMADIARRAALPKDHPDYAIDDNETTGTMGIRDNATLRQNADELKRHK